MNIFTPSDLTLSVTLLIFPGSSMMSLASTLDPMRAANRISNHPLFNWSVITIDNNAAPLSCGVNIPCDIDNDQISRSHLLIVLAGFNQFKYAGKQQQSLIRRLAKSHEVVCGVESGSLILALCGLLDHKRATTHWEDLEEFRLQFPLVKVQPDRFVIDGNTITTGGAAPTFDFMLRLIQSRHGYPLALDVSSAFIYQGEHQASDIQPIVSLGLLENREPRIASAIKLMEKHIEEPVSIKAIATTVNLSSRSLETLFNRVLNITPAGYYRYLRLQAARRLVMDTHLSMREIALRTGYNSLPAFSRSFKQYYQHSPVQLRQHANLVVDDM